MKTNPMSHQIVGCSRMKNAKVFALGAEQGTGKTWMLLADAERLWLGNEIDAMLVIAPNGVHTNWALREVPTHLGIPYTVTTWVSGATAKQAKRLSAQLTEAQDEPRTALVIHAMNVDALNTTAGFSHANTFVSTFHPGRVLMVIDESHTIKNPSAMRTKRALALGARCAYRRIASGTLVANSPLDLYSQYEFLASGLLGTRSYRAYVAEYAEVLRADSPLVISIMTKNRSARAPCIVAKNKDGSVRYRNLDKLSALMAPYTFRVTKAECLDLPAKIYQTIQFQLTNEQKALYNSVAKTRSWLKADGTIDAFTAMTVLTKLRQITSGFILEDGEPVALAYAGSRLAALKVALDAYSPPFIIWASFTEEIRRIAKLLDEVGLRYRTYHGETGRKDRDAAIDEFQNGTLDVFLGNPAAAGLGLTLTAAETVLYYSSSFSLTDRLQSEDRCHRIGTNHHVVYIDIVAVGTIDERIAAALQAKLSVSETILANLTEV